MYVSGTGITPFTALVKPDFKPKTKLALNWVRVANGNYVAADRGASADIYQAAIRLYKKEADVNTFIDAIEDNRITDSHIIALSQFSSTEHIFGADVDHSGTINTTVLKIGDRRQESWKAFSLSLTLQAISPSFTGTPAFPTLKYLLPGFTGDTDTQVSKFESYNGTFAYADRDAGTGFFEGTFVFTDAEMKGLRRYLAVTARGGNVSVAGISGVTNPWGPRRPTGYPITVKIIDWEDLGMRDVGRWQMKLKFAEVV